MILTPRSRHISARFGAAAPTYDRQPGVQPVVAEKVIDIIRTSECLNQLPTPRVLEIGCGTGALTELLIARFPTARILAVDIAEAMVEQARQRLGNPGNVTWQAGDIRHLNLSPYAFDLMTSSSALHWVQPLKPTLKRLRNALTPGGTFICGVMSRGTLQELHDLRREIAPDKASPVQLPAPEQILDAVRGAGMEIVDSRLEQFVTRYDSGLNFLRILNRQGVTGGIYAPEQALNRAEIKQLVAEYEKRFAHPAGGVAATYNTVFIRARNR